MSCPLSITGEIFLPFKTIGTYIKLKFLGMANPALTAPNTYKVLTLADSLEFEESLAATTRAFNLPLDGQSLAR